MSSDTDLIRLHQEYANRKQRLKGKEIYSFFYPPYLFALQQRTRSMLFALKQSGLVSLNNLRVLEMGCGGGGILLELLTLSGLPRYLFGIDLLQNQLIKAQQKLPNSGFTCADGQRLPFSSDSFDLVLQYTAFSSVMDNAIRREMASDMLRVLQPKGFILWYDFWINPTNPQTRGIWLKEIKTLFPNCNYKFYRITLAPPIARRVVPISWAIAQFLEWLKIFNSHYLVIIQKNN